MTKEFALQFARTWVDRWNSRDLDEILFLYTDDFTIESPLALSLYPGSEGVISGKSEVRKYWSMGLAAAPGLRFELLDLFVGVNSIGLYLLNTSSNKKFVELMSFNNEHKVNKTIVTHHETDYPDQ